MSMSRKDFIALADQIKDHNRKGDHVNPFLEDHLDTLADFCGQQSLKQQKQKMEEKKSVDKELYAKIPSFGVNGGPGKTVLTDAGKERVAKVATGKALSASQLDALREVSGYGESGANPTDAILKLAFAGLAKRTDGGRYVITSQGKELLDKVSEEETRLIQRIDSAEPSPSEAPRVEPQSATASPERAPAPPKSTPT